MYPKPMHQRLARLQRECEVSAAPAILLLVASAVLVVLLGLGAWMDEAPPAQAAPGPATPSSLLPMTS